MTKNIYRTFLLALTLLAALALLAPHAGAAEALDKGVDKIEVDESGTVSLISGHIAEEEVCSVQLTLELGEGVGFTLSPELQASRLTYVSGGDGTASIYIAGASPLMSPGQTALVLGAVSGGGETVRLQEGSLQYVYGKRMIAPSTSEKGELGELQKLLEDLIYQAQALDPAQYTAESYAAVAQALTTAQDAMAAEPADSQALAQAYDALDAALAGATLSQSTPRGALQSAVESAAQKYGEDTAVKDKYTPESWNALLAAVDEADKLLSRTDPAPTDEEINAALAKIRSAESALVPVGRASLDSALQAAQEKDGSQYTADSYAALQAAIENAKAASGRTDATEEEWLAAEQLLQDAMSKLVAVAAPDSSGQIFDADGGAGLRSAQTAAQTSAQTAASPTETASAPAPTAVPATATPPAPTAAVDVQKRSPNTGDESDPLSWLALLGLCAGSLALLSQRGRRCR